jgi:hypothetical protein
MQENNQSDTNELQAEIERELRDDKPNVSEEELNQVARKPFRITEFDAPKDREMAVFTQAKKLSEYIFVITEKSPKKLRWSIVSNLRNTSLDIVANLYRANFQKDLAERVKYQTEVKIGLALLDTIAEMAKTMQAINIKQTAVIAKHILAVTKLLAGWMKSDKSRMKNA